MRRLLGVWITAPFSARHSALSTFHVCAAAATSSSRAAAPALRSGVNAARTLVLPPVPCIPNMGFVYALSAGANSILILDQSASSSSARSIGSDVAPLAHLRAIDHDEHAVIGTDAQPRVGGERAGRGRHTPPPGRQVEPDDETRADDGSGLEELTAGGRGGGGHITPPAPRGGRRGGSAGRGASRRCLVL